MDNQYIGKNSKTEYAFVKIKQEATMAIYLFLIDLILGVLFYLCLYQVILDSRIKVIFIVLSFLIGYIFLNILGFIIAWIVRIVRNIKVINYYKNNPLEIIQEVVINYDYKLWQTAAINSFHPMSFKSPMNFEITKTAIIFTNHSHFGIFPKFKMPDVLKAKNYIEHKALMGYDRKKTEWIIIDYVKK